MAVARQAWVHNCTHAAYHAPRFDYLAQQEWRQHSVPLWHGRGDSPSLDERKLYGKSAESVQRAALGVGEELRVEAAGRQIRCPYSQTRWRSPQVHTIVPV